MNKVRLEWVMSGLNQHSLTSGETLFLKTVCSDFDKNQALSANQEERLENLYKEKSKLAPNKQSDFSVSPSAPKKTRARMPRPKSL
jgi:hypothetical protein